MQFLVILKPKPDHDENALRSFLKEENVHAWTMMTEGVLRSLWYLSPPSSGAKGPGGTVCILECADDAEAQSQINRLPLVQNHFVSVELLQLNPFNGFELLFEKNDQA